MFIIDDIIKAIGANNAAAAQEKQAREAMGLQREIYGQSRADQTPYMQAGQTALGDMMNLGRDPGSIANNPAYQFRLAEGTKALERSAAARGGLGGGRFMKGLARYSSGVASEEYGNQWGRLAGLAGMGQNSAQNLGLLGGHYADSMSNLYGAVGNAQSAGATGVANGIAGGVQSLGDMALFGLGGGFKRLLGGGGGINPGASTAGASTGYVGNYIPRQGFG